MSATDLLWVHTNGGTVTIKPSSKHPNMKLFYVGSSGISPLTGDQRRNYVTSLVIEFAIPKDGVPGKDIIVVETLLDGNRVSHLLELVWREDGSSRIDLGHTWVNIPGRMVQSFATAKDGTGLTVVVSGKVYTTTNTDHAGSNKISADAICQYVSGRIPEKDFLEMVDKATIPVSANSTNVAAEQLAGFLLEVFAIASEPFSFNLFRSGRISRIRKLWKELRQFNRTVEPFRKYLNQSR